VDAAAVGALERFGCARNVAVVGTRKRANGGVLDGVGNRLHRLEVAVGAGGKTGFDDIHAQALQLAGNAQLLVAGHGRAGRLLAIAQGGVKNDEFVSHGYSRISTAACGNTSKQKARCGCIRAFRKMCACATCPARGA